MRTLVELRDVQDPAWPGLADAIAEADGISVLPVDRSSGEDCLVALQVTARSTLGALALHTGGLLADSGWLRILGGGTKELPSLAAANGLSAHHADEPPQLLLVAFDVLGGRFAVNGGGVPGAAGEVNYWAADDLQWTPLGVGHTDLVRWALGPGVGDFYASLRWSGWKDEVEQVRLDQGLSFFRRCVLRRVARLTMPLGVLSRGTNWLPFSTSSQRSRTDPSTSLSTTIDLSDPLRHQRITLRQADPKPAGPLRNRVTLPDESLVTQIERQDIERWRRRRSTRAAATNS